MVVDAEIKALLSFQILAEMRINLAPMELYSHLNIDNIQEILDRVVLIKRVLKKPVPCVY